MMMRSVISMIDVCIYGTIRFTRSVVLLVPGKLPVSYAGDLLPVSYAGHEYYR